MQKLINNMAVLEKTDRRPDYYNDIETFGKCAEDDFIKRFYNSPLCKNKTLFDVRKIKEYQEIDVDFIIDKEGENEITCSFEEILYNKRFQKIEVKCNSVALTTGWIAYESVSHGSLGWGDITKCDLIYQVFTEKNTTNIIKRAWIDMKKWKQYLADRKNKKKLNIIKNEDIVDILCNINDMSEKDVLTFL